LAVPKLEDEIKQQIKKAGKNPHLMVAGQLQLAAWKLSGNSSRQQELREKLQSSWQLDGAREQIPHIREHGNDGLAGVMNGKLIPFLALFNSSFSSQLASLRRGCSTNQLAQFGQSSP